MAYETPGGSTNRRHLDEDGAFVTLDGPAEVLPRDDRRVAEGITG